MFETVVLTLIYITLIIAACWLVIWVVGQWGIALPPRVMQLLWVVVVLLVILLLWRMLGPLLNTGRIGLR